MNKFYFSFVIVIIASVPAFSSAKTDIQVTNVSVGVVPSDSFFDVDIKKVTEIEGTNLSLFYFSPVDIKDESKISSWKVRFYCDKDMSMRFIDVSKDSCNKAVSFANSESKDFFILFENKTPELKQFTFALKAYDKNGKWIHTKKSNFSWN